MIAIGSIAPDFTIKDQDNKTVRLSALKGEKVLLAFKPLAWTPVCTDHIKLLEENHARFEELNTAILSIGVDSVPTNKAWAKSVGVKHVRLLSDFWPHGEVAKLYGVFRDNDGFSERATIIISEEQKVIFTKTYPTSQLPDVEEIIMALHNNNTRKPD
jgi:peroxiredoxin